MKEKPRKGVDLDSKSGRYRARITRGGAVYHLGLFATVEEANKARCQAERALRNGKPVKYTHKYQTTTNQFDIEGDPYLQILSLYEDSQYECGEERIRVAVLLISIKDILNDSSPDKQKNARDWVEGKIESHPGFSMDDVCDILDIDKEFLLNRIRIMTKTKATRRKYLQSLGRILVRSSGSQLTSE